MRIHNLTENPIENVQLNVDPLITELVVGTPSRSDYPSDRLAKRISVPVWNFEYQTYGTEHLEDHDTERAMRAKLKSSDWEANTLTAKLRRYGWSIVKDQDEINNAHPALRIRERSASQAREIVTRDIETRLRDFFLLTANYVAGHDVSIAGGDEWDAAGADSRSDIRTQAKLIFDKTGIGLDKLSVFLPDQSLNAALDDVTFLAARQNFDTDTPDVMALQRYWGVGSVFTGNPTGIDSDGDVTHLYGDIAIVFFEGDHSDFDTEYGRFTWISQFAWNRGVANTPFYEDIRTSWHFPWHDYRNWALVNNTVASIIRNTAA